MTTAILVITLINLFLVGMVVSVTIPEIMESLDALLARPVPRTRGKNKAKPEAPKE